MSLKEKIILVSLCYVMHYKYIEIVKIFAPSETLLSEFQKRIDSIKILLLIDLVIYIGTFTIYVTYIYFNYISTIIFCNNKC